MKLSIITINFNDAAGLQRTLESVRNQTFTDYEQIIVDGASTDGSLEIIHNLMANSEWRTPHPLKWVSEPDRGVYDAQNKGIGMATGEYCFFLNAGDVFCNDTVWERIFVNQESGVKSQDIIYGNELVVEKGKRVGYCKGVKNPTFLDLYNSCMKHQATFIRRELFERFGLYDINLQIVADWEWFFRVIAFHDDVTLQYVDVDVANFDNEGVSNRSPKRCREERQVVLDRCMSKRMQADCALLSKYYNLRYVDRNNILRFLMRVVGKVGKMLFKR